MNLDARMNSSARRFAARARRLPERADIEEQRGTEGESSATPSWVPVEKDWPCFARPVKEAPGARETPATGNAPSYSYELIGPAAKVRGATVAPITVSKEMRVVMKKNGAQPQKIFSIVDFAIASGVELRILATLND